MAVVPAVAMREGDELHAASGTKTALCRAIGLSASLREDRRRFAEREAAGDLRVVDRAARRAGRAPPGKQSTEAREPRIVISLRVKSRPGKVTPCALLDQPEDDDAAAGGDEVDRLLHRRRRAGRLHDDRHAFAVGQLEHRARSSAVAAGDRRGAEIGGGRQALGREVGGIDLGAARPRHLDDRQPDRPGAEHQHACRRR